MGGTTHVAWLAEWPAGPRAAWMVMGRRLQGIFPASITGVEKTARLVTCYTRTEIKYLAEPNARQVLLAITRTLAQQREEWLKFMKTAYYKGVMVYSFQNV